MSDQRVTRQVVAVVLHEGVEVAKIGRVFPETQFLTVAHQGKVTIVRPTGRKDYPGFQGLEVWK